MNPNDPAFPAETFAVHKDLPKDAILKLGMCQGLTKREYFAAMAMKASCTRSGDWTPEELAIRSIHIADALIAELSK